MLTLNEYMKVRMGNSNCLALTGYEATLFGVELKKNWFYSNENLIITDEMLDSIYKKYKNDKKNNYINRVIKHIKFLKNPEMNVNPNHLGTVWLNEDTYRMFQFILSNVEIIIDNKLSNNELKFKPIPALFSKHLEINVFSSFIN
jgi:hypothetical protein